jgi:hypothetical protein
MRFGCVLHLLLHLRIDMVGPPLLTAIHRARWAGHAGKQSVLSVRHDLGSFATSPSYLASPLGFGSVKDAML